MSIFDNVVAIKSGWGGRLEDARSITERVQKQIDILSPQGGLLAGSWGFYFRDESWTQDFNINVKLVESFIFTSDPDTDGRTFAKPEWGFDFSLYTGKMTISGPENGYAFNFRVGNSQEADGDTTNRFTTSTGFSPENLSDQALAVEAILRAYVIAWKPDWAAMVDDVTQNAQPYTYDTPIIGALTWFADHLGNLDGLAEQLPFGKVERFEQGTLVDIRQDGEFPTPEIVAVAYEVLNNAGVMGPIPAIQP